MSSGGGSSAAIQALPQGTWQRPQNDLRGFVKTGANAGGKENHGILDATRSVVQPDVKMDRLTGNFYAVNGKSPDAAASADEINNRRKRDQEARQLGFVNVAGSKSTLGG